MKFLILIFHDFWLFITIKNFGFQKKMLVNNCITNGKIGVKIFKPRIIVYSCIPKVNRAKTVDLHVIKTVRD